MKWMQFIPVTMTVFVTCSAAGSGNSACDLTLARGLVYDDGVTRPIATLPVDRPTIPVALGEKESIIVLKPVSAPADWHQQFQISADPLRAEVYKLGQVPTNATGSIYDVLVPLASKHALPNEQTAQQVYLVDVEIPPDTLAGLYMVKFQIGDCAGSFQLQVHDVLMPPLNQYIVQATVDPHAASSPIVDAALTYGINSFAGVFPRLYGTQVVHAELRRLLSNPSVLHFRLPLSQYHRNSTFADRHGPASVASEFKPLLLNELMPYGPLLDDPVFHKKLLIKLWDEPVAANYAEVVSLYSIARALLPDIPLELAEQPSSELADIADIWTVHIDYLREYDIERQHAAGNRVLIYGNMLHAIRRPSDSMRRVGWILWRFGLDGYHFWRLNWWSKDPWTTSSSWDVDFDKTGTFVYPVPGDGIFASVRLLSFREGLEDAALLQRLETCTTDRTISSWLESLRRQIFANAENPVSANLYDVRKQLLLYLESCKKNGSNS